MSVRSGIRSVYASPYQPSIENALVRSNVRAGAEPAACSAALGGPAAIAGRIGRELVGVDRRCQRALIQAGPRDVDMRDDSFAPDTTSMAVVATFVKFSVLRLQAAAMRALEIFEQPSRPADRPRRAP